MLKVRRVLSIVCLLVFLGLPLSAQSERGPASRFAGFLDALWERLTSPITSVWEASEGAEDPNGEPMVSGQGIWDPFG
ncbi:MAG TPA: hypothetical protein VN493_24930 [Thermoanaerobaculia bacterium]|nr:hypothetical protein [Thermoanaerobaculia bacterium]